MFHRIVLGLAVFLLFTPVGVLADDVESLQGLLDEFLAGASVDDAAMHDRFWADDLVYTSSSGARYGKAQIMAGLSEAAPVEAELSVYSADQVQVRLLADDVAVITFRLVATPTEGPVQYFLNSGVFQHREGEWRASIWQATRVPPAGA